MSPMGKSGSRSSGVTGCFVPGWITGDIGPGRSGMTLYQWVGIWFSDRRYLVCIGAVPLGDGKGAIGTRSTAPSQGSTRREDRRGSAGAGDVVGGPVGDP